MNVLYPAAESFVPMPVMLRGMAAKPDTDRDRDTDTDLERQRDRDRESHVAWNALREARYLN